MDDDKYHTNTIKHLYRRQPRALQLPQKDRRCRERLCQPQHEAQLHQQAFYLTVVHTTSSSLNELKEYLRDEQKRHAGWFLRQDFDNQFQINRDRVARSPRTTTS
eukprot:35366-Amphidinium_carterae.1